MREIKFRAWDKNSKEMIQTVNLVIDMFGTSHYWLFGESSPKFINPKDFELMQYTGLKDKNGKEVYEGDIVNLVPEGYTIYPAIVQWAEEGFWAYQTISSRHRFPSMNWYLSSLEVIGNIYENPELAKEKSNG